MIADQGGGLSDHSAVELRGGAGAGRARGPDNPGTPYGYSREAGRAAAAMPAITKPRIDRSERSATATVIDFVRSPPRASADAVRR